MKKIKLSCTLATFNEEENISRCLVSVIRQLADCVDEIVVVDGGSSDNTVKIAKQHGAEVIVTDNPKIFHINKQKANDLAKGEWILQLDADEVISSQLASEVKRVIDMSEGELTDMYSKISNKVQSSKFKIQNDKENLFLRHQKLLEQRDGKVGSNDQNDPIVAFFIPRKNYFLGRFLRYGGTYPDGVIRLFKKDKARLPCKSVHEQYEVAGRAGWLNGDLLHYDSLTFGRYLVRNSRYAELFAREFETTNMPLNSFNFLYYMFIKPFGVFLSLYFRHKGFLDGFPGLVWAIYSGLTWRTAWVMNWEKKSRNT